MTTPTGTAYPPTKAVPSGYAPINPMQAPSRLPGRGKAFQGTGLSYMSMSDQGLKRPALSTETAYPKVAPDAKGPA